MESDDWVPLIKGVLDVKKFSLCFITCPVNLSNAFLSEQSLILVWIYFNSLLLVIVAALALFQVWQNLCYSLVPGVTL